MALTLDNIFGKVESLRRASSDRDQRHRDVHDVRSGDIDTVIPGSMPEAWPKPIEATLVDTRARDIRYVKFRRRVGHRCLQNNSAVGCECPVQRRRRIRFE